MNLLINPKPHSQECLSSYIQGVATANFVDSHDLWRLLLPEGAHYPQSSMSSTIDMYPYSYFDLKKLESMLGLPSGNLEPHTYIIVNRKLGIYGNKIKNSRVISGLIDKHRRFCPNCLNENRYYKLIWQVKEILCCDIHSLELISRCPHCNKQIPIIPANSRIGFCPYCNRDLAQSYGNKVYINKNMSQVYEDWTYLLDPFKEDLEPVQSLTNEQSVAAKVLYLSSTFPTEKLTRAENTKLKSVMQIARDSKQSQTFVHLGTILSIIRKANISFEDFIKMRVPEEYINSLLTKKELLSSTYSCIAPWCSSYMVPGSLRRTATSKKVTKDGSRYHYYMYCDKCGIEYRLSGTKLLERSDFINFAWYTVKDSLMNTKYSLSELSKKLNATVEKVRRAVIFLAANGLINKALVPIELPEMHNQEVIDNFISLISSGLSGKQIKKELKMKYSVFLYYWFHPKVSMAYINRNSSVEKFNKGTTFDRQRFEDAIEYLFKNNTPITIKQVSDMLKVCPETLRNWRCLELIKTAKKEQRGKIKQQKRQNYIEKANQYITKALQSGIEILSEDLYKFLGSPRTVIVRDFPDVTSIISKLIFQAKIGKKA